jgi:hypothetical protein
MDRNPRKRQRV